MIDYLGSEDDQALAELHKELEQSVEDALRRFEHGLGTTKDVYTLACFCGMADRFKECKDATENK